MSEELKVLKIVTDRLNRENIAYMISGSIAANYYTVPRMTRDIDIVVELKKGDLDRFVRIFQEDFYIDKDTVEKEILRGGMFNLIHNEHVIKVDFIIKKTSSYEGTAFSRKKEVLINDSPIWFISPEDLIVSKLSWAKDSHSEMQIKDVKNLFGTVKGLDFAYIENWVLKLGLEEIFNKTKQ